MANSNSTIKPIKKEEGYHKPVLLQESVDGLNINPEGVYIDVTFGGGGHSKEIVKQLSGKGMLYGFDQDADAERNIINNKHFTFVRSNFRYIENFMKYHNVEAVDGVLADLGVSSHHFDAEDRGFSFRFDGVLDMRMNMRSGMNASDILNTYSEEKLADVFFLYGEIKSSRRLAKAIAIRREQQKIKTIGEFLEILKPFVGKDKEKRFLAQAFQALRIEVNDEMGALKDMLEQSKKLLNSGGRLVVITYHSLEDRLVKNFLKAGNFEGKIEQDFYGRILSPFKLINNKVIVPTKEELEENPRSRSAKLRIAEKL